MARMTKTKIQIKDRYRGNIRFEYEKENNSIRDTLIEALKKDVNLQNVDLSGADLHNADLYGADLYGADLSGADLRNADLSGADLRGADLRDADLHGAILYKADLRGAILCYADLRKAYLNRANLRGAKITGANFRYASLVGAKNVPHIPLACPREGTFIGWKKVCGCLMELRFVLGLAPETDIRQMLPQSPQTETIFKYSKMICTNTQVQVLKILELISVQCQV